MRLLFATTAGSGHFHPMVPVAMAALEAGHDVIVAAPEELQMKVEALGFTYRGFPGRPGDSPRYRQVMETVMALPPDEQNRVFVREVFGRLNVEAGLPAMLQIAEDFRPDVIMRTTAEGASWLVADRFDVPHVSIGPGTHAVADGLAGFMAEGLGEFRTELGLRPDPDGTGMRRAPLVTATPASLDLPGKMRPSKHLRVRAEPFDGTGSDALPPIVAGGGEPLVYATLGTVATGMPMMWPGLAQRIVAALAELPVRCLFTIGSVDPSPLGPIPANVVVAGYVRQSKVLPFTSAVVCHGGANTVLGSMYHGVPLLVIPGFADQPHNAAVVAAAGAGLQIALADASVETISEAVGKLLKTSDWRDSARRVRDEIQALPPPNAALDLAVELVGQ